MNARELVAWNLRRLRVAKGVSVKQLAEEAGIHFTFLGRVERGTSNSSIDALEKLCGVLGVRLADLLRDPPKGETRPRALKPGRPRKQ